MSGPSLLSLSAFLPNETKLYASDEKPHFYIGSDELGVEFFVPHFSLDSVHARIARHETDNIYRITALPTEHGTATGGILLQPRCTRFIPPECVFRFGDIRVASRQTGQSPFADYLPKGPPDKLPALVQRELRNRQRERMPVLLLRVEDAVERSEIEVTALKPREAPYLIGAQSGSDVLLPSENLDADADLAIAQISLTVTPNTVRVTNTGETRIRLGLRSLDAGEESLWDRLDMLQIGPVVFALFDPVAFILSNVTAHPTTTQPRTVPLDVFAVSPAARRQRDSGIFAPRKALTDALLSTLPWGGDKAPVTRSSDSELFLRAYNTVDGRSFAHVTAALPLHIGRDFTKSSCVLDDLGVSRQHASVGIRNGELFVFDANSTNGTYANGQLIDVNSWVSLGSADVKNDLSIGPWRIALQRATPALVKSVMKNPESDFKELPSQYIALMTDQEDAHELLRLLRAHKYGVKEATLLIQEAIATRERSLPR